jgi:ribosomal protein S3
MGQKTNPTIFRLGINKTWKTEFFEKKNHELPLYTFKDLEIKDYLERILDVYGIILHDYKQHYNDSTLNLYISYFVTSDFILEKKNANEKIIIENSIGERKFIKRFEADKQVSSQFSMITDNKTETDNIFYSSSRPYKLKQYLDLGSHKKLLHQVSLIRQQQLLILQKNQYLKKFVRISDTRFEGVFAEIFKVLSLFIGNRLNIVTHFCCINKPTHFLKSTQKKTLMSLKRLRSTSSFKNGIELLFHVAFNKNSAHLLAKFIAFQLKKIKRHKFLLSFLKQTLSILLSSNLSKANGIKVIIKGRLNGVPRAKHKIITIGDVPVQSIAAKLDYSQTATHNSNGSYGIKVWIVEK